MISKITTHVADALARLIEQYKDQPNLAALVQAFVEQIQDIEDAAFVFQNRLDVNQMEGAQLDKYGVIVGQRRQGLDDPTYRLILIAKIGVNISNGEPERVISTFKIITQANFVHYINLSDGEVELATDGFIPDQFMNIVFTQMEKTLASGVRIDEFIFHDSTPFGFAGATGQNIEGFGTVADPTVGGDFATLRRYTPGFSFDGNDTSTDGFGSLQDPIVGGGFSSL